ncbi:hypothetical protein TRFO_24063 [Tritrichomonas foetus]|uniref:VASt domain-containing protein n=1 Tax=Tritrichomonas foetus TaxID=1144522 RepID=A0A1J4K8C3_9EUKA|nr:hypothetical protein TRFO_24063 [Tritrichomonas foetus]|eukprot:OHT07655.1 hypothetical protein TRFO_24063 [Tritrichomonas foetus]
MQISRHNSSPEKFILGSESSSSTDKNPARPPTVHDPPPQIPLVNPNKSEIILKVPCSVIFNNRNITGDLYLIRNQIRFIPRQISQWMLQINCKDITQIAKINRRSLEKGIEVTTSSSTLTFTSVHDRDNIVHYIKLLTDAQFRVNQSFGFLTKDDTEVVKHLTVLRAPHVFEETFNSNLQDIITLLKKNETISEIYSICECTDVVFSGWSRNKDGLTRNVQYTQPMFQPLSVASVQTIMKSGDTLVFEINSKFSRTYAPKFLTMNFQLYFHQEGEITNYRGAYVIDSRDTWDKEFVEASIAHFVKIFYYYLKAKICDEQFNEADYEGEWRRHQPYVNLIIALLIALISINLFPKGTNWYGYFIGSLLIIGFFYLS